MSDFVIDEHIAADSTVVRTALRREADGLNFVVGGAVVGRITDIALRVVLRRYGRDVEPDLVAELGATPSLALTDGAALHRWHWRAAVDADARDWLVLIEPGAAPKAALSPGVAAALRHLVSR